MKGYVKRVGDGNKCPKCKVTMERRARKSPPKNESYFFTQWDYCPKCSHVQHYEEFKSSVWVEVDYIKERFKNHLLFD